eukprot:TRINITY_DN95014_c0_g1_i1.p1 TRINITY_DN95014_c0_g1~~TRINITY_DN95014_c0_g1_i1.p1  ORF type:complete len:425 (+),score=94.51 TRINITY_DN95014_c0_g1_i1:55-1329(+)
MAERQTGTARCLRSCTLHRGCWQVTALCSVALLTGSSCRVVASVRAPVRATEVRALRPWSIAAWNQHRKSSYLQKDCVWMRKLLSQGHAKAQIISILEGILVSYSPAEIQRWASNYDVLAVQEADPLFRAALGDDLGGRLIHGSNDLDGRGIEVESTSGLLLPPHKGVRCLRQEGASLVLRPRRSVKVAREHLAVLVERPEDGQQLVLCSVHLHVPSMVERARVTYLNYLKPLRAAVEAVAGVDSQTGQLSTPCMLLGDFNIDPDDFKKRTQADPFWNQFELAVPDGGDTAHHSNPCRRGDFALTAGGGQWSGRSLGSPSFDAFERHAGRVSQVVNNQLRLRSALKHCEAAVAGCKEAAALNPEHASLQKGLAAGLQLDLAQLALQRAKRQLSRVLAASSAPLRRNLMNSDHRPLHFQGTLPQQ